MVVVEGIVACAEAATGARTASTLATTGCAVTTGMLIAEEMVPACEAVTGTAMACTTTGGGIFVYIRYTGRVQCVYWSFTLALSIWAHPRGAPPIMHAFHDIVRETLEVKSMMAKHNRMIMIPA